MTTDEITQLIQQYANDCGIDPGIAVAQAQKESQLNPNAFNPNDPGGGAKGLMQFTSPAWAQWGAGSFDNAFDIYANLNAWCAYMQWLLARYNGDYTKALQAYNGGPRGVDNGIVSPAAQAYAAAIVPAFSGGATIAAGNGGGGGNGGGAPSSMPAWLIVGAIGLAAVLFMRD
ncbi:MAG: lytic transglycosylase domain-containing protein [Blastocatellia bacterium]|nr:lytic transglycosylase domain-containing protein [Blastocatellia bacterium]